MKQDENMGRNFRLVLVQAQDKRRLIDMKIIDEEFKDYELAKVALGELHLSSQKDLQLPDGYRFPRD